MNKGFLRAGHLPTLFAAFLYFDLSFMVWALLGLTRVKNRWSAAPVSQHGASLGASRV